MEVSLLLGKVVETPLSSIFWPIRLPYITEQWILVNTKINWGWNEQQKMRKILFFDKLKLGICKIKVT